MKRKLILFSFIILLCIGNNITAQAPSDFNNRSKNSVFVEVFGNAPFLSVNYDRLVSPNISLRTGLGVFNFLIGAKWVNIPMLINFLPFQSSSNIELGIGTTIFFVETISFGRTNSSTTTDIFGTASISYRYSALDKGIFFKIGLTPIFSSKTSLLFGGISFGATF